jgi:MFS family permease
MTTSDILFNIIVLSIGRSLDLISTWYCTPNFDIEVNSWMKKVGWRGVILINIVLVLIASIMAHERTIFLGVLSCVVALRNFQAGTMARAMGEQVYITAYRQFVRNTPWYFPLIPIFCEVLIYVTIGMTIIELIGKPENENQRYVGTIGAAFLTFGLMLGSVTIAQRIEKKYFKNN